MAEYKNIFSPKTLGTLKGKSKDTLSKVLKGRSPGQMQANAFSLVNKLEAAEADYKDELEALAVQIAKEVYPVIDYAGIGIDAKLGKDTKLGKPYQTDPELLKKHDIVIHARGLVFPILMHEIAKGLYEIISKQAYHNKVSPEKRRIINSITQGGAVRGAFSHYNYKDYLDLINPELTDDYAQVMDDIFGGYHDENQIAKLLQVIDRYGDQLEGVGRVNVSFPKRKESGGEEAKKVTNQVDTYKNELDDIRFGQYIYNNITKIWVESEFDDPRVRDLFLAELYKIADYDEFYSFVENAINDELTNEQKRWAFYTMRDINSDLKKDDTGLEGLDEMKRMQKLAGIPVKEMRINIPGQLTNKDEEALWVLVEYFGESDYGFDLYEPARETYRLKDYEDLDEDSKALLAIRHLLKKSPGTHVTKDIFAYSTALGAPPDAYYTAVNIDRKNQEITVYSPYAGQDEDRYVGWFDSSGKYYPDVKNFDEDGNRI
jgi:hypothetical protein